MADRSRWTIPDGHDPLGVLATTRPVVESARSVAIDRERVTTLAAELADAGEPPAWDADLHWRDPDDPRPDGGLVFALDALNFCFWAQGDDPGHHWRVREGDRVADGYEALAVALRRAMDEGVPLTDPAFLATIGEDDVARLLRPDEAMPGTPAIPLFPARVAHLRELGARWRRWAERGDGDRATHPALAMIAAANGSAAALVRLVVRELPSFDDVATYDGRPVRFYKRAQILVGDLAGAFGFAGPGAFTDLDGLTAFADYKVPQVLRRLGVLRYAGDLARRVERYERIAAGSPEEVEIRAATIWACELLRRDLTRLGPPMTAFAVDWALWTAGQSLPKDATPYHRTVTTYY